ncbi:MAG: hypothetical protein WCB46_09720, partial [Methanoregula sp.]
MQLKLKIQEGGCDIERSLIVILVILFSVVLANSIIVSSAPILCPKIKGISVLGKPCEIYGRTGTYQMLPIGGTTMCGCKLDNDLPNRPDNPSPSNFARDLAINQKLQWSGGDPQGEIVKYIIYFDSHWPSTTKIAELNSTSLDVSFNISNLSYDTDYHWRVNASDGLSPYVEGPSWSFTTGKKPNSPPEKPSMPSGSNHGLEYKSYDYSTTTTDPDKDSVKYNF